MSKVLIVDDSHTNLALLRHLVRRVDRDIETTAFDHARKGLDWLEENIPDLIIVDYNMPETNGIEFIRSCRNMPSLQGVPIAMVTSTRERIVCLEALRAGASEFLNSPVKEKDFVSRIKQILQVHLNAKKLIQENGLCYDGRDATKPNQFVNSAEVWSQLEFVLNKVPVMICAASSEGYCVFINALQAAYFGCNADDVIGKKITDLPKHILDHFSWLTRNQSRSTKYRASEFEQEYKDQHGTRHVLLTTQQPIRDEHGSVVAILGASVDITARKEAEENLAYVAGHDSLTELPNRLSLRQHMEKCIDTYDEEECGFTLLFIDIDRFKDINDSLGHDFGDRMLHTLACRLDDHIQPPHFVARLGGDEFAVVISNQDGQEYGKDYARDICKKIQYPMHLDGHEIRVSVSIGIASYPTDAETIDELFARADLAMYGAKSDGGNGFRTTCHRDHARVCKNASMEVELRTALDDEQFQLYYQPKVRLSDRKIIGAEALIRWNHPERGLVPPLDFLPLAEQNGLILPIGEWVLNQACQDAGDWVRSGYRDVGVSVNVSPCQFAKQNISDLAHRTLKETSLPAPLLAIELTEQSIIRNTKTLHDDLDELRSQGVKLSLDDFGTGYASLRHVQQLPITELKIDRSFVKNHTKDSSDFAIVSTIIGLAQNLNLDVVAEGAETLADVISLENAGCHSSQGYYFSPPVPLDDFRALLRRGEPLGADAEECCA